MSDVVQVEDSKPAELDTPAVAVADVPAKSDDTPAVTETPAVAVEETPATAQETPATEEQKDEAKPVETEKRPKSPGLLAKLIAPFKNDKKAKAPKSPKKEKKKEEVETPATEEAPKPVETPAVAADTAAEHPKEVSEPVKETETSAAETTAAAAVEEAPKEEKKEDRHRAAKFTRRLSARVGDLFKKSRSEVPTTAKVDEHPPKIDEPTPVAPLENPATETSAQVATLAEPSELAKPVEAAPTATPIVAAAA
jgi:hypothetical protein